MPDDSQIRVPNTRQRPTLGRRLVRVAVPVVAGLGLLALATVPAVTSARNGARLASCNCRGKQLAMALLNYHDYYHGFPPAYIADADGKPMHSWRVLLLPFMCEQPFYNQYHFDEPWDGPNNSRLAADYDSFSYRCPAAGRESKETNYVAVVGPETMWPGADRIASRDVSDGTSKTILLVEVAHSGIEWWEPRDMTLDEALAGINSGAKGVHISSQHPGGAIVIWADAHVSFLPNDFPKDKLRALLTANGGEEVGDPNQP